MSQTPKDTLFISTSEWAELSRGILKRLGDIMVLNIEASVVEMPDKTQAVAIPIGDLSELVHAGLRLGLKPRTKLERQFIALCVQKIL